MGISQISHVIFRLVHTARAQTVLNKQIRWVRWRLSLWKTPQSGHLVRIVQLENDALSLAAYCFKNTGSTVNENEVRNFNNFEATSLDLARESNVLARVPLVHHFERKTKSKKRTNPVETSLNNSVRVGCRWLQS